MVKRFLIKRKLNIICAFHPSHFQNFFRLPKDLQAPARARRRAHIQKLYLKIQRAEPAASTKAKVIPSLNFAGDLQQLYGGQNGYPQANFFILTPFGIRLLPFTSKNIC